MNRGSDEPDREREHVSGNADSQDLARHVPRRLTLEEQQRGLEAFAELERLGAELQVRRGGVPFSNSGDLLNEIRDERTRQLEQATGREDETRAAAAPGIQNGPDVPPRLTPEEQQRALRIVEELTQMHAEMLARRGGKPFPNSWELINEERDKRTRQLEQALGRGDDDENASQRVKP